MPSDKQFTYTGPHVPAPIRLFNAAARLSKHISGKLKSLNMHALMESACRRTRLSDWGDQRFKKALALLVDSLDREGALTFFGRFTIRQFIIQNLGNRLRIVEAVKHYPDIGQQEIVRPVFITGWYRTGTTYLHNLLAADPNLRAPLFWELRHPCPAVDPREIDPQKLIRNVRRAARIHGYLSPGFSDAHAMPADKPEECLHLFENAFCGTTGFFITEAKAYGWCLLQQEFQHGYEFYKLQLQLLNWLRSGHRWVLKWPYHLWHLDTLLNTFPDAIIIQLHRDPVEAIGSVCSLAALARSSFCERIDDAALGRFWLEYSEAGLQRGFAARTKAGSDQMVDIRYRDLMTDPETAISRIYKAANLGDDKLRLNLLQANFNTRPTKEKIRHRYEPSQFGIDPGEIRERFASYIEDFDLASKG